MYKCVIYFIDVLLRQHIIQKDIFKLWYVAISNKSEWLSDARFDILLQKATFEGLNECEINVMVKGMISHDLNYVLFPTVMLFLLVFNIPGFTWLICMYGTLKDHSIRL